VLKACGKRLRSFRPHLNLANPTADTAFTPGIWDAAFNRRPDDPPRTLEELEGNN